MSNGAGWLLRCSAEGLALMRTAGLDFNRLAGLLRRMKVDCTVLEGDESADHCLIEISSVGRPGRRGVVEYVNLGIEPRVATIHVEPDESELHVGGSGNFFWISMEGLNLRGPRRDDPKKIAQLVEELLLDQAVQS